MTIITASYKKEKKTAYMAADSHCVRVGMIAGSSPKIVRAGAALVGSSGVGTYTRVLRAYIAENPLLPDVTRQATEDWACSVSDHITR